MRMKKLLVPILLTAALTPLTASADTDFPEDQVSFQVEAGREVDNDRAVALLAVTAENREPAQLAREVNEAMHWALDQLRGQSLIKSRSGGYQTFPVYDDGKIVRWRARQEVQLETGDVKALSQMLGVLQTRLQIQSLQFSVSPEKRQAVESSLIEEALAAFRQRAQLIRKSLDAESYSLMDINVNTGGTQHPVPLMRAEAMSAAVKASVPPAFEQGTSRVTVQVNGRINLLRD